MAYEYSGFFLKERIRHDTKTMGSFATVLHMNPRTFREKVRGRLYFSVGDIQNITTVLNVTSASEGEAYFFFHKDKEHCAYLKLYKALLKKGISINDVALTLRITIDMVFDKIMGKSDFYWNEAIAIKEKYFPEIPIGKLFERGA